MELIVRFTLAFLVGLIFGAQLGILGCFIVGLIIGAAPNPFKR